MDYFVIGAANYVQGGSKPHASDVPSGSLKYFWSKISGLGGFALFEATPSRLTLTFIDGEHKELYQTVMLPRK